MKSAIWTGLGVLVLCSAGFPALAQDDDPYAACAATADDADRLQCFDTTYRSHHEGRAQREADARVRSAEQFGLNEAQVRERNEQLGLDALADGAGENDGSVSASVVEVFTSSGRRPVVLLSNGQLWAALSSSNFRGTIEPEAQATVTKSWSGGYRMRFEGRIGFLSVKRLR